MIKATASDLTAEEIAARLSHPDALFEIVDGAIVEKPEMGLFSTMVGTRLARSLADFTGPRGLGIVIAEAVFVLDPARPLKRRPDVAFLSFERWPADRPIPDSGDCDVAPDVAIEILSPRDVAEDPSRKLREYLRYGVRQVWQVRPIAGEIYIYDSPKLITVFDGQDDLVGSGPLEGFRASLPELFRRTMA